MYLWDRKHTYFRQGAQVQKDLYESDPKAKALLTG